MVLKPIRASGNTTPSTTSNKCSVVIGAKTVDDATVDSRNDAADNDSYDDDSDDDGEGYADFLAFLSTPTSSPNGSPNSSAVEKKKLIKEDNAVVEDEPVVVVVAKAERDEQQDMKEDEASSIDNIIIADDAPVSSKSSDESTTVDKKLVAEESSATTSTTTAPIAIEYFTKQATIDEANRAIEMRALAKQNMAPAHAHFDEINHATALERSAQIDEMIKAPRPAAVEYFTALDMDQKEKKRAAIADESMDKAPPAVEYFTKRAQDEKNRKAAEIEELKNNPPPPSAAGKHFQKVEEQRQVEIANMANEPAPVAIEYFTSKAKDEKDKNEKMLKELNENPPDASAATKHFAREEQRKEQEQEAMRSQVKSASSMAVVEPLPFDHFNKQGQAETEARAKAARELSESQMPIGIKHFTAKGDADKKARRAEARELSQREMSMAGRHFAKLAEEKEAASVTSGEAGAAEETMPAAIQHFTVADRAAKARKKAEIELLKENPPPLSAGQEYFTSMDRDAKDKKAVEIQALKDNPPVASTAAQHFAKREEERKVVAEAAVNEPAPQAIEYFTNKANVEKSERALMLKELNDNPPEASAATKHFAQEKQKKEQEMEAARAQAVKSSSGAVVEPLPFDHFTKLGEKEVADRAQASKKLAESQMPSAIKYFTAKGAEDKKTREAELRELSQQSQSMAGRHFAAIAAEKEEAKKVSGSQSGDVEAMPAAIQHFTVMAREESMRKKEVLKSLKNNPPEVSTGVAHFNPELSQ